MRPAFEIASPQAQTKDHGWLPGCAFCSAHHNSVFCLNLLGQQLNENSDEVRLGCP
jgi:hypothetical protein